MKDKILEHTRQGKTSEHKLNRLREALHHMILQEADRKQAFNQICFLGGTALRIVYGLDRFSEDLDFSLSNQSLGRFDLASLATGIQKSLDAFGLSCKVERFKTVGAVQSCFFTFQGLLHEVDRHFRDNQKLAIKFDVDTRSPPGAVEAASPITAFRVYKVRHYDLASLFAGKLHAILYRTYTKGRDLYDFLWYTGKQIHVNRVLLENAIEQTQKLKLHLDNASLRSLLAKRFQEINFEKAKKDVAPFLEDPESLSLFEPSVFMGAAEKVRIQE